MSTKKTKLDNENITFSLDVPSRNLLIETCPVRCFITSVILSKIDLVNWRTITKWKMQPQIQDYFHEMWFSISSKDQMEKEFLEMGHFRTRCDRRTMKIRVWKCVKFIIIGLHTDFPAGNLLASKNYACIYLSLNIIRHMITSTKLTRHTLFSNDIWFFSDLISIFMSIIFSICCLIF